MKFIYKLFSIDISYKRAFYISFLSLLGRYLPGRFWVFGFALAISKSIGLDVKSMAKAQILYQFFLIYSAIPMLCFYFYELRIWFLIIISSILLLVFPFVFHFLPGDHKINLNINNFLIIFLFFSLSWLFVGFSLYFFILAFNFNIPLFYSILIFPISYNAGILSLIAPAGIGIREGVMIFMLNRFLDLNFSNKLSVLFRIFNLLFEIMLSFLAYIFFRRDKFQK